MDIGKVRSATITGELSKAYLDYAMSVIVARALPDIRDGLKPVHRRILYAMHQMGLSPSSSFTKSAKVVGEVLGKFHPHGDSAVYDALVRLAQDFSMRYPLIKGQGNFGSIDGDSAAAMRYTEVKLDQTSLYMLKDIEKETVDFTDNFDTTLKEPEYLPAQLPNLLLMGSEGIAVGMATKIPPHNLSEVADAVVATIKKGEPVLIKEEQQKEADFFIKKIDLIAAGQEKEPQLKELKPSTVSFQSEIAVDDIVKIIPGPDFPTGGAIYGADSMRDVYATGRGRINVRGIAKIDENKKGKTQIIITEIPYQVNKSRLVAKIADLVRDKKIVGISDLRDESDKDGMRVAVDISRSGRPKSILNNLYKYTQLQTTFPANFVALIDGIPQTVNVKTILVEYVKHRQQVVTRRTIFELTAAKKRAHILEGLLIALDHLDEVIATIRASRTQDDAKKNLIEKFKLTEIQSVAILDMQLRRLAALEREKIENEYKEAMSEIERLTAIIRDPQKVLDIIKDEIAAIKDKFGDERKTKIYKQNIGEFSEKDLIPKEEILITLTKTGYIKSLSKGTFKAQRRGGKGVLGMTTKEEDEIEHIISATTHDQLLFFTNKGKVYGTNAWELPEASRQSKGQAIVNILDLEQGEEIRSVIPQKDAAEHLILSTANGTVKKTHVKEFSNLRSNGLIAIKLNSDDSLVSVSPTSGNDHILLITKNGMSIRFPEENVRPMGRATTGVKGIALKGDDEVIGMEVFSAKMDTPADKRRKFFRDILTISCNGLGKKTPIRLFPVQKRAGKGVKAGVVNEKTGKLASAIMVTQETEQIVITSTKGQVIKLAAKNIPELGRATQGVILMRFAKKGDEVAAVTALDKQVADDESL